MMTPEEMRQESARKQKALPGLVEALSPEKSHRHWREGGHRAGCRYRLLTGTPPRNHAPARTPRSS